MQSADDVEEQIWLYLITEPSKHYNAKWKFEAQFPLELIEAQNYRHSSFNESTYGVANYSRDQLTAFLQEMQQAHEIVGFFFEDEANEGYAPKEKNAATRLHALDLALIALQRAEVQNCFPSDYVVRVAIEALTQAHRSSESGYFNHPASTTSEDDLLGEPFKITSVSRQDLIDAGFPSEQVLALDELAMEQLAGKMSEDYCSQLFWNQLRTLAGPLIAQAADKDGENNGEGGKAR